MAHKETYELPSVKLELEFNGDEKENADLKHFRSRLKQELMKCLVDDGVAFQERPKTDHWKKKEDPDSRLESVIDAWVHKRQYPCKKLKDKQGNKVRWGLECEEPVTILAVPNE